MVERKPVAVVIPYYRNAEELERCLKALGNQKYVQTEVFVRDNSEDNILYTRAVNEGLRRFAFSGAHDFILVLTQDVVLDENALSELMNAMERDASIGIAAPIQMTELREITWAGSLNAYPWGVHNFEPADMQAPFRTFWANGACFMVRVSMIHDIGLMDENMMFVSSDCDYSFTARVRGWEVYVVPRAVVQHALKSTSGNGPPQISAVMWADQLYFAAKWLNGTLYKSLSYEGEGLSHLTVKSQFRDSIATLRQMKHEFEKFQQPRLEHRIFSILKSEL